MRQIKRPKPGQYVLATIYPDKDPKDPWFVGYVDTVHISERSTTVTMKNDPSKRTWKFFFKITEAEGEEWLRLYTPISPLISITYHNMGPESMNVLRDAIERIMKAYGVESRHIIGRSNYPTDKKKN